MCATERVAISLVPGTHASTFGGNPLAAACACAVMDVLIEEGVLDHGRRMGSYLGEQLEKLAARHASRVVEVRGVGLLRAVELKSPAGPLVDRCREDGVLLITAGEKNLRLAPPLVIEQSELQHGLDVLDTALAANPE
jgi:acetylornithine/succinyldiaminopimelate/putrescine aminotransferase